MSYSLSICVLGILLASPLVSVQPTLSPPQSTVQDVQFQILKNEIQSSLKGSWCTEKKIDLMMDLIYQNRPEVCVEIGVFTGSSLLPVAATLKYLDHGHVYAVDAWSNEQVLKHVSTRDVNYAWWSTVNMAEVKIACMSLLHKWSVQSYCTLIPTASELAVEQVPEIDFLHLDGNFSEAGALLDAQLYLPKVKSGGYILLSRLYQDIDRHFTKMPAVWMLFDSCEIICNVDPHAVLFRKH